MLLINDEFTGPSSDCALDIILKMPSAEDQAQALIRNSHLARTRRGAALMKKIAAPTTPGCKHLYEVLLARKAERASKKAARNRKHSIIKPKPFVGAGLFDLLKELNVEDTPPASEDIQEDR